MYNENILRSNWWYFMILLLLGKFDKTFETVRDDDGFASKFTLSCFKLIAVIDCASKMMMSSARVIMLHCFWFQICCSVTRFILFLLRTIVEFFFCVLIFYHVYFHIIHKYWTRNSFYSIFGFDLVVAFYSIVFQTSKTYSTNHVVCACLNAD